MDRRQLLQGSIALGAIVVAGGGFIETARADSGLEVAHVFLPTRLDPGTDGASAFNLVELGMAETLVRVDRTLATVPWLAESLANIDPLTWEIRLRENGKFWDGSPVDAQAVVASLASTLALQPDAANFIDPATELAVVDPWTLRLTTPEPQGNMPNSLASFQFIIRKSVEGGDPLMTAAYRPVRLVTGEVVELEAFADHWSGQPGFDRITIQLISDANTRVLALQAGDVDLISQVPVQMFDMIAGDLALTSIANTRVHSVVFNFASEMMQDSVLREAFAMAIDRDALNVIGLEGQGLVTTTPFPATFGVPSPIDGSVDIERAKELLEGAGWVDAGRGVRERDGVALALRLLSYPSRPELTSMAVSIQDQLGAIGFAVEVREVEDITAALDNEAWDATMWSFNPLPTGDPLYVFNTALRTGGVFNRGAYSNAAIDAIADQLRLEADPSTRDALTAEGVAIAVGDTAAVWLLSPPRGFAYRRAVMAEYAASPNDLYFIDETIQPAG